MKYPNEFVCECREFSTYTNHVPAPVFRKSIRLEEGEKSGEILICGLGFYELFVNGKKITKGALAPYISNPDHLVYYDRYELTPYLQTGENVIGIMLGDGFLNGKTKNWNFCDAVFRSAPKLAVSVSIVCSGNSTELSAMDFSCKKGPIVFNDLRSGVFYDKRREEDGWNRPGFVQDESWHAPLLADKPRGTAKLCEAEPIAVTMEIAPVSVTRASLAEYAEVSSQPIEDLKTPEGPTKKEGGFLYDFGENNAGIFRLKIKGKLGQRIDIQCAEQLKDGKVDYGNIYFYPDGYVQRDIYIVGSDEEEILEPPFTYHGFRYLYVSGIEEDQATPDLLTYLVMSSDLKDRGFFSCSDEMANTIFLMAQRSDRSNFYYFPTDCPHREKNGWTGDAQASAEHMILTMGVENSWREWLNNIRLAQREDGALPGIVPTDTWGYEWGSGPAWDRVLFELPYMIYKYRGTCKVIRENAHAMLRYLEYVSRCRDERGIVEIGLGDWVPVGRGMDQYEVPLGFTDSVMVYQMCREAAEMFEAVDLPLHASFAEKLGKEMRAAIRREYLDCSVMLIKSECQSAQAMGIFYDIFEPEEKQHAFRQLMKILERDGVHLTCGFLGTRVLFHVLAQNGEAELAYRMITGTDYPSYGYYAKNGWTTLPEQFLPKEQSLRISQNHHFLGDVVQWYMRYPGGIRIENCKKVTIHPCFIQSLTYAEAYHDLPDGRVQVKWKREGEAIELQVICPDTVPCTVELDEGYCFAQKDSKSGIYKIQLQ